MAPHLVVVRPQRNPNSGKKPPLAFVVAPIGVYFCPMPRGNVGAPGRKIAGVLCRGGASMRLSLALLGKMILGRSDPGWTDRIGLGAIRNSSDKPEPLDGDPMRGNREWFKFF
jgi:hypothetical protein